MGRTKAIQAQPSRGSDLQMHMLFRNMLFPKTFHSRFDKASNILNKCFCFVQVVGFGEVRLWASGSLSWAGATGLHILPN